MRERQASQDVSQVRPWKLTPETGVEAVAVWPGPEGALVDWSAVSRSAGSVLVGLIHMDANSFLRLGMQKLSHPICRELYWVSIR
jgi:hypothetical protein